MFQSRKRCSRIVFKTKSCIFWQFCPKKCAKVCKSAVAHRTSKKGPHARTSRTLSRMDFARTRTRATAHRTCACAHAPSQLIACALVPKYITRWFQILTPIVYFTNFEKSGSLWRPEFGIGPRACTCGQLLTLISQIL